MVQRHVVVVANGEFAFEERLFDLLDAADVVIAADGGANWLVTHGRRPDILVGDMDSVSAEILARLAETGCRMVRHAPHKDETDTELALMEAVALGASQITLLGALGGRIDHEMANILLLAMPQLAGVPTSIYDGRSCLSLVARETIISGECGDTVSLIPLGGDACGITTEGLEYPLCDESLLVGPARGVSNVLVASEARISVESGRLLVVHTPRYHLAESHG